jgi:hypothetical protein
MNNNKGNNMLAFLHQEQAKTSNVSAVSNTSIVVSNTAIATTSSPLTPTNIVKQFNLSATPSTITPTGMQQAHSVSLVATTKRKLHFNSDDDVQQRFFLFHSKPKHHFNSFYAALYILIVHYKLF